MGEEAARTIDIRGLVCPMTFVKAKLAIEDMITGGLLSITLDYEPATRSIPNSMRELGHEVLAIEQTGPKEWRLTIRKRGE